MMGCGIASSVLPSWSFGAAEAALRCINVVNFIREIEPRFPMDMMLPVRSQMAIIRKYGLPATWLLQYDALVLGPFVPFLKSEMAADHEVGFWFEMNEKHCRAAGVEWRGRPGYEWDFAPPVAFTIGYTQHERRKLADTAMRDFKKIWGHYPKSVASWNLDAFTVAHLAEEYGVDAFAVCRDQIATDGFTIWGAPIAGYYPSRKNCWSPALDAKNQIHAPVFRMLGQDPVYYYGREYRMPGGRRYGSPDTMEPVWPSGQNPAFVSNFLAMISSSPSLGFAYAQLGQENTFPWDQQLPGYEPQMRALAKFRQSGKVHVETMGESGGRFKKAFLTTPAQSQVMLNDPFQNYDNPEFSIWYQSRFYRANLHFRVRYGPDVMFGDNSTQEVYFRDITVYSDTLEQPFLHQPTRQHDVEQRALAVLDGYHWSENPSEMQSAGGFLYCGKDVAQINKKPVVLEQGNNMAVRLALENDKKLEVHFSERGIRIVGEKCKNLPQIRFTWDRKKSAFRGIAHDRATYDWHGFGYSVRLGAGHAQQTDEGWSAHSNDDGLIEFDLAQDH